MSSRDDCNSLRKHDFKLKASVYWIDPSRKEKIEKWESGKAPDIVSIKIDITNASERQLFDGSDVLAILELDGLCAPGSAQDADREGEWIELWRVAESPLVELPESIRTGHTESVVQHVNVRERLLRYSHLHEAPGTLWAIRARFIIVDYDGRLQAVALAKLSVPPTSGPP